LRIPCYSLKGHNIALIRVSSLIQGAGRGTKIDVRGSIRDIGKYLRDGTTKRLGRGRTQEFFYMVFYLADVPRTRGTGRGAAERGSKRVEMCRTHRRRRRESERTRGKGNTEPTVEKQGNFFIRLFPLFFPQRLVHCF